MAEQEGVTDPYRHLIGTEHVFMAPEEVGRVSIRKFALAIGEMNPLYVNRAAAPWHAVLPFWVSRRYRHLQGRRGKAAH